MRSINVAKRLFLLSFLVLVSNVSREPVAIGMGMHMQAAMQYTDPRVYRSLSRKMLAFTGSRHSETIAVIVNALLDQYDGGKGGVVFFNPTNGEYHLVKGEPQQEGEPFSHLEEYLVKQRLDGLVFALSGEGFYSGMYKGDQHAIRFTHYPMQFDDEHFFVSDAAYYQDLHSDLLARIRSISRIRNIDEEGAITYFSVIKQKLVSGRAFNLFDLLKLQDSIATLDNDDELFAIFEYFYIESLKRNGVESIPSLQKIGTRVAALDAVTLFSARDYLNFRHRFGWNRGEFESYLLGDLGNLGSDSIARLRLMEGDRPHLRAVLDEILEMHRIDRADFEQALVEVSRVFHMLDIDTRIPTDDRERVDRFLTAVAKRKNKVLHQYFFALVLRWKNHFQSGQSFLLRIHFIENMILRKRATYPHQTVRKFLEELGIDVDVYLDYTSNLYHRFNKILAELEGERVISSERMNFVSTQMHRYVRGTRVETIDMLSNIVAAIRDNFTPSVAKVMFSKFLSLHPDVAIIKEGEDQAGKTNTRVSSVAVTIR